MNKKFDFYKKSYNIIYMNINYSTEHYLKIGLQSSLKNIGIYRKFADKIQKIDTYKLKCNNFDWKFKCYNKVKFEKIRNFYGIESNYYINSLCTENIISGKTYPKSGAKFWKTSDNKYIVKTITKNECKFFRHILKKYSNYIQENNTYLVKILGLYRIILPNFDSRFIIMNNIFEHKIKIDNIFDLKGTTEERFENDENLELKDINFTNRNNSFILQQNDHNEFITTIVNDTQFLKDMIIMDYSLIVAIIEYDLYENIPKEFFEKKNIKICVSENDIKIYIFGIIDFFQKWTLWKRCCGVWKKMYYRILCCDQYTEIDSENPYIYRNRFINFIKKNSKIYLQKKNHESSYEFTEQLVTKIPSISQFRLNV